MLKEDFIIERTFNAPVNLVWKAITDSAKMKQWYFDLPGFKAEKGYKFEFLGGPEHQQYKHLCEVTEVVKEQKLSYTWRYEGYEGNTLVTFELTAEGEKTKLKLTHSGFESFPKTNPDFAKENFAAGWTHIIGTSLKDFLEK